MKNKFLILFYFCLLALSSAFAQNTKIVGKVIDKITQEPLPYVNIIFKDTQIGTISDMEGGFRLETKSAVDALFVSFIGYEQYTIPIQKHVAQTLVIELVPSDIALGEIVVKPGENPAFRILRMVDENRDRNNPNNVNNYSYEAYNKIQIDLTNITDDLKKQKALKDLNFAFNYVDTSEQIGKNFLPVFITETVSDYYYQDKPTHEKEVIKAHKMSGTQDESIAQYTGKLYLDANIYDNYLVMFDRSFASPIAPFGKIYYDYYLTDSAYVGDLWCYKLEFKPKRKQESLFKGTMWIERSTWGLKSIEVTFPNDINLNYVKNLWASQEFSLVDGKQWFLTKDVVMVDFHITNKSTGLFGRKITTYKNINLEPEFKDDFFKSTMPQESVVLQEALTRDLDYWKLTRHEELSSSESGIYEMVDSIQKLPIYRTVSDLLTLVVYGYHIRGNFEYGPYFTFYSFNPLEGNRFRFGGRTSNQFSKKIMLEGHLAYGSKDQNFKYGIGALYIFNKEPRAALGVWYKDDMEQLGASFNAFRSDNILGSVLNRNPNDKLLPVRDIRVNFEKDWFLGFTSTLDMRYRHIFPSSTIAFNNLSSGTSYDKLVTAEITLGTRFAYNEKFVTGEFMRMSLGSEYPIIELKLTAGIPNLLGSQWEYYRTQLTIRDDFYIGSLGRFEYIVEGGKIFGTLPYPLLKLHEGNETYAFDKYAYNMMNYYEFVSDSYISAYAEHHFNGLFLNKMPLFRHLKWREVVHVKALTGLLSDKNRSVITFPETLTSFSGPYVEGGIGLENIFKILRVDAVYRFTYLDHQNIQTFGIRARLQIIF